MSNSDPRWDFPRPNNGMGTASLVLGIIALVLSVTVFVGIICGLLAVIFGLIGRGRAMRHEATNGGSALAGTITGAFGFAIAVLILLLVVSSNNSNVCVHIGTGNPCPTTGGG